MLKGEIVDLRCVKEADLPLLYTALSSLHLRGEYLPGELLSEHQFLHQFLSTGFWSEAQGTVLLIRQESAIGAIWFERQKFLDCFDLHFLIFDKSDRNQGYMTEALTLFCRYLFATKKIERLQISIPDYSKAALHLAQRCRFQFEGIARSALFYHGRYLDLCIYSLLRSECKNLKIS